MGSEGGGAPSPSVGSLPGRGQSENLPQRTDPDLGTFLHRGRPICQTNEMISCAVARDRDVACSAFNLEAESIGDNGAEVFAPLNGGVLISSLPQRFQRQLNAGQGIVEQRIDRRRGSSSGRVWRDSEGDLVGIVDDAASIPVAKILNKGLGVWGRPGEWRRPKCAFAPGAEQSVLFERVLEPIRRSIPQLACLRFRSPVGAGRKPATQLPWDNTSAVQDWKGRMTLPFTWSSWTSLVSNSSRQKMLSE